MVPVGVGEQQGEVERLGGKFLLQLQAERTDAAARVENDDFAVGADFHAGGVAAVKQGGRPRRRNRAAHAPKSHRHRRGRGGGGGGGDGFDRAAVAADPAEQLLEICGLHRLDQIFVRAGFERVQAVGGVAAAGGHDDPGVAE